MTSSPSFAALCTPIRSQLLAKASQLCRDRSSAEDLVQDAYVHALAAWHTFRSDPSMPDEIRARSWLFRILLNVFRDQYRSATRRAEVLDAGADEIAAETMGEMPPAPGTTIGDAFEDYADDETKLAMAMLSEPFRDVILRTARGEDDLEIAAALGIDRRHARKRLHRARRRMADALAEIRTPDALAS